MSYVYMSHEIIDIFQDPEINRIMSWALQSRMQLTVVRTLERAMQLRSTIEVPMRECLAFVCT